MHHTRLLIEHLESLGLAIDYTKSTLWPARQIVYVGLRLDSASMRATLTVERWARLETQLARFSPGEWVTYHSIKKLLCTLCAAHQVIPLGMLFLR